MLSPSDLLGRLFEKLSPSSEPAPALSEEVDPKGTGIDEQKLSQKIQDFLSLCDKTRWSFERLWFRSILYYLGNQWLSWDQGARRWREKKVRKWVPKPVTNRYASSVATVCAAIQSTKVEPSAWPATNDHEDIATANVADRIIDVLRTEIKHERVREELAKWVTLNGDAFAWLYYDKKDTSLGNTTINAVKCPACGGEGSPDQFASACPMCGSPADPMEIPDPNHPAAVTMPVGRLKCRVLSPLQVYFNMDIVDPADRQNVAITVAYELETVKSMYAELKDKIQPDTSGATRAAQYFLEAIAYSSEDSGYSISSASGRSKCTLVHYFELPTTENPDGRQCTMTLDGTVCEAGPLESFDTHKDGTKNYFLPIVQFGYEKVPGRAYSKTPIYDLLSKQDQLNRLESLMELASMKGVNVNWLLPAGSSISNMSGEPAQIIRWTPTGTSGAKPEVVTVAPFHAALLELKKGYEADFEELAGTFDALKGNTPKGVSAGYAIQLLTERSYGRFGSVFANWETGWVELYSMCLKLFRTYASEPRYRKIKGAAGAWEIQAFTSADLTGSVDLRVEGGAARPKSKLAEQALIEAMFNMGIINPGDPEQRFQVADMFGMSSVLGSSAEDERAAAGEWQALLDWEPQVDPMTGQPAEMMPPDPLTGQPSPFPVGGPMVDQVFDNHLVHTMCHRKPVVTDVWKQLPEWKKLYWRNHQIEHLMAMQAAQMAQMPPAKSKPAPGKGDDLHAGSKADEMPDAAANVNKGSSAMGSGGANQYGG